MKVTLEYKTHHYFEEYNKTDVRCPSCGEQTVWESTEGDYYSGNTFLCLSCNHDFNYFDNGTATETYKGIIEQLKSGIQTEPISRKRN